MDYLNMLYPQKEFAFLLKSLKQESINVFPWIQNDFLVTDEYGNTIGFITESTDELNLYNQHMNMIASTNEVQDFTILHDYVGQNISYVHEVNNGFTELSFSSEQVDAFSNAFGGFDFTRLGELEAQSSIISDHISYSYPSIEEHFMTQQLSTEISNIALEQIGDAMDSLDFLDFL